MAMDVEPVPHKGGIACLKAGLHPLSRESYARQHAQCAR